MLADEKEEIIEELKHLLAEHRFGDARDRMRVVLSHKLDPEERGMLYARYLKMYMEVMNNLDRRYLETLKSMKAKLERTSRSEAQIEEAIRSDRDQDRH